MKGPMKGATISHAKQRIVGGRYLGLTEPGIIAAEAPNPIVNELVILPDIEKRLEAFVRVGHGVIIFPGGAGTAEEFLYLLGILMHPDNQDLPFPVILTGPRSAEAYLQQLHEFVGATLGHAAQRHYRIVIDDPAEVAKQMAQGLKEVKQFRRERNDAFHFNWMLKIDESFQRPFEPTHENMASLQLSRSLPPHELAANLRRAFSGIVAGNVKDNGIRMIEQYGPYEIHGDPAVMLPLDRLLQALRQAAPDEAARRRGSRPLLPGGADRGGLSALAPASLRRARDAHLFRAGRTASCYSFPFMPRIAGPDLMSPSPSPALAALRDATRDLHAELDRRSPLGDDDLDDRAYLDHAGRILGWLEPLERAARQPQRLAGGAAGRSAAGQERLAGKRPAGRRHEPRAGGGATALRRPAECDTGRGGLRVAYVMEGATLGGAYLYKRLAPRLPGLPLQWLQGYGQATGVRWQEFLEQLARQIDSPEAIGLAQDAAQATFLSFRRWVLDEA